MLVFVAVVQPNPCGSRITTSSYHWFRCVQDIDLLPALCLSEFYLPQVHVATNSPPSVFTELARESDEGFQLKLEEVSRVLHQTADELQTTQAATLPPTTPPHTTGDFGVIAPQPQLGTVEIAVIVVVFVVIIVAVVVVVILVYVLKHIICFLPCLYTLFPFRSSRWHQNV